MKTALYYALPSVTCSCKGRKDNSKSRLAVVNRFLNMQMIRCTRSILKVKRVENLHWARKHFLLMLMMIAKEDRDKLCYMSQDQRHMIRIYSFKVTISRGGSTLPNRRLSRSIRRSSWRDIILQRHCLPFFCHMQKEPDSPLHLVVHQHSFFLPSSLLCSSPKPMYTTNSRIKYEN